MNKLMTKLLNLPGVLVENSQQTEDTLIFFVKSDKKTALCPRCGQKSHRIYQNQRHLVKDLPLGNREVVLCVNRRRFKCGNCQKPFSEMLDFVPEKKNFTHRYAETKRSLHILGFYPDADKLREPLGDRLQGRFRRSQQIVDNLAALGYPIQLPKLGEGMAPGRPHIAMALVKAGYVQSPTEAFDRWLGDNKPAYVNYEKFSIIEGIDLLRSCGAVPVWAHPYLFRGGIVEEVLKELVDAGLMGVEVYHPSHSSKDIRNLKDLCAYYGLIMTGGSDYHGPNADNRKDTENTLNMLHLPLELLEPIKVAANSLKTVNS
ncbi:MAG TPA: transposase family protein [Kamptonema sp.]|nr:transposase family protein [Kamptonema sp.]